MFYENRLGFKRSVISCLLGLSEYRHEIPRTLSFKSRDSHRVGKEHRVLEYYQDCSKDKFKLIFTFLRHGQICFLAILYGKIVEHKSSWELSKL